jgi:hypothetical protein
MSGFTTIGHPEAEYQRELNESPADKYKRLTGSNFDQLPEHYQRLITDVVRAMPDASVHDIEGCLADNGYWRLPE